MKLPEGLTFTLYKRIKDSFGRWHLVGRLECSVEYIKKLMTKSIASDDKNE